MDNVATGIADIELEDDSSDVEYNGDDVSKELEPYLSRLALTPEDRNTLKEILKCAVCLEVPQYRQVRVCEKGHHFCNFCHKKLKTCAICRGKLLTGRNFVVEELIMKLGKPFGLQRMPGRKTEPVLPPKGTMDCPYGCTSKLPAKKLLCHFRAKHAAHLRDQLMSNPYTGWFQMGFTVTYTPDSRQVYSFQVSDIGLLSLVLVFSKEGNFRVWIQMPRKDDAPIITYRVAVSNDTTKRSQGTLDVPVFSYAQPKEGVYTIFPESLLPPPEGQLIVHLLVASTNSMDIPPCWTILWNDQMIFTAKRSSRKTMTRNIRRKKLRAKYRDTRTKEQNTEEAQAVEEECVILF